MVDEPALTVLNMRLRNDYVRDTSGGIGRWNKVVEKNGVAFEFCLPHDAFNRYIGEFSGVKVNPEGEIVSEQSFIEQYDQWLPSTADADYVTSLMKPETEVGKFANWICPPKSEINKMPGNFEYVKIQ